ncbi:helix-turn-helix domain-containing protein, partial [Serratia marcescens]|nr:helix-turn-helix domain-containing protein [Serratia marcescens]
MNYIIDDVLVYCPDDGSVSHISKPEEIIMVLTPVLNRILLLLIENQGSLVPRDLFFEKVWDNYGKNASSHTLSQYMGVLRKIFENELGASCIDTIP